MTLRCWSCLSSRSTSRQTVARPGKIHGGYPRPQNFFKCTSTSCVARCTSSCQVRRHASKTSADWPRNWTEFFFPLIVYLLYSTLFDHPTTALIGHNGKWQIMYPPRTKETDNFGRRLTSSKTAPWNVKTWRLDMWGGGGGNGAAYID